MPKILILYFSQYGHTKDLAYRISKKLENASIPADIKSVPKDTIDDASSYKLIFIGSPVYYGVEPLIWEEYISRLPDLTGKAGVVFSTYGAANIESPERHMLENLTLYFKKKNLKILYSSGTICESTYPPLKKLEISKERPNEKDLEKFDCHIDQIIKDLKSGKVDRAIYDFSDKTKRHPFASLFRKGSFMLSPGVKADNRKCRHCNVCVEVCPAGNIRDNGSIKIGNKCIKCYMCEKVCPQKAVYANWKLMGAICGEKVYKKFYKERY
ncbi:MAG: EFR1 family ferrodoxin [Clostridia bacterium]|nr:EFR1 family ferrodoxin [Clostridia bacterium]